MKELFKKYENFIYIFLLIIITFSINRSVLDFGFSGLDDNTIILKNYQIISNISEIKTAFERDAFLSISGTDFYRPLQTITYMIDAQLCGENPWGYHLTNLILHIFIAILIFFISLFYINNKLISFTFSLIFSIHPLFTQAVAWIPSRGDLLCTLFFILSIICFHHYIFKNNLIFLILNFIFFVLSLLSKETALLFPLIYFTYYLINYKNTNKKKYQIFFYFLIMIVVDIFYFYIRSTIIDSSQNEEVFGILPFFSNLPFYTEIIFKFILPMKLSVMPFYTFYMYFIGLIFFILIFIWIIRYSNKQKMFFLLFLLFTFLVLCTPGMFWKRSSEYFYNYLEHRAYLPLINFFFIFIIMAKQYKSKILFIFLYLIVISFSIISLNRLPDYKDELSFYSSAINTFPKNVMALINRGNVYKENNQYNEAINDYSNAIKYDKKAYKAFFNRGKIYEDLDNLNMAEEDYSKTIIIKSDYSNAYCSRGVVRSKKGNYKAALSDFNKAIELNPKDAVNFNNRGILFSILKDFDKSYLDFSQAIKIDINYSMAYFNRGLLLLNIGNIKVALPDLKIAAKLGNVDAKKILNKISNKLY